jgi:hypothetical protein
MEVARPGDICQTAEAERNVFRKPFDGKELFTGLMCLYTGIYKEMVKSLQSDHRDKSDEQEDFKQQRWRRRKRSSSEDQAKRTQKVAKHTTGARDTQILLQLELLTRNFFAPLRTTGMKLDST